MTMLPLILPINVTSKNPEPAIRLIRNFAATPFELNGASYAAVEGFWQSFRTASVPVRYWNGEKKAKLSLSGELGISVRKTYIKLFSKTKVQSRGQSRR